MIYTKNVLVMAFRGRLIGYGGRKWFAGQKNIDFTYTEMGYGASFAGEQWLTEMSIFARFSTGP